ncbi:MAG: glutathione S-transferase N-terminal domain-containing protein [Hyphomicrobiales bacterium]|nr:glutathione S-transferase N-terminal domain-containing protein [Hyphomicrobiales bacterium]MBV8441717.1 glutathione S-transferase N-terminal domain-containing protein [Hyphomicrobiales bacterium]
MKLFYSPGSCALGVHILMEEIGAPFGLQRVNFAEREQYGEAYRAISPKSKVPALERDDGSVLTEYQAISIWLALTHPEKRLIPTGVERHARMMEAMEYVVGTIHASGFRRVFRPAGFAPNSADHDAVKAEGLMIAKDGLALIDKVLAGKDFIVGDFSIADPALFYVTFWAVRRLNLGLPSNVQRHYEQMVDRPAVRKALKDEGL